MSLPSTLKKPHLPELQLVRAIAILSVLAVHASSSAIVAMKSSSYYFIYNFANIFLRFGTPTFILLSSFVLFYSYYDRPINRKLVFNFYKKRLLYIIVPYILFSIIYYFGVRYALGPVTINKKLLLDFWEALKVGKTHFPFSSSNIAALSKSTHNLPNAHGVSSYILSNHLTAGHLIRQIRQINKTVYSNRKFTIQYERPPCSIL